MITKVTSENRGLYRALFEKASNELSLTGDQTIDSLDKYFSLIQTLIEEKSVTYSFLPLDEPTFDINADTRVITIPSDFKKNGISVKGDHYAEILYFTIDRYFDTQDLYDDNLKIYIQWEDPQGNKGVSLAVFKDVTVLASQNKMLFGWALTDTITKSSGNVKFSVRFFEMGATNELAFSLSTLTASAVINPGLDYQFTDGHLVDGITLLADDAQNLRNRFRNSPYTPPTGAPEEAEWILNLPDPTGDVLARVDLDNEGSCSFVVEAKTESGEGVISYLWKWIPTGESDPDTITGRAGDVYEEISATTIYDAEKTYYIPIMDVDTITGYEVYQATPGVQHAEDTEHPHVFLKKNGLTITHTEPSSPSITGEYYVIAQNRVGIGTSTVESNHVIIPGPAALESIVPAGAVTAVHLGGASDAAGTAILNASASTVQDGDMISYTWGTITVENPGTENAVEILEPITGAVGEVARNGAISFTIDPVENTARKSFDRTYGVELKANRNGDATEGTIRKFRVTDSAHQPTVQLSKVGTYVDANHPAVLTATVQDPDTFAHDEFTYQWFLYNASDNEGAEGFVILGDTALNAEPVSSPLVSNSYSATQGGNYYCKVCTVVNGSTSEAWVPTQESQLLSLQNRS